MSVIQPKGYIPGDRLYRCDICGFGYRFSQMRKGVAELQKGFDVCPDCFDPYVPTFKPKQYRNKLQKVGG